MFGQFGVWLNANVVSFCRAFGTGRELDDEGKRKTESLLSRYYPKYTTSPSKNMINGCKGQYSTIDGGQFYELTVWYWYEKAVLLE